MKSDTIEHRPYRKVNDKWQIRSIYFLYTIHPSIELNRKLYFSLVHFQMAVVNRRLKPHRMYSIIIYITLYIMYNCDCDCVLYTVSAKLSSISIWNMMDESKNLNQAFFWEIYILYSLVFIRTINEFWCSSTKYSA